MLDHLRTIFHFLSFRQTDESAREDDSLTTVDVLYNHSRVCEIMFNGGNVEIGHVYLSHLKLAPFIAPKVIELNNPQAIKLVEEAIIRAITIG